MSGNRPQLECKDIKRILKHLGFEPAAQKGTSHEQWKKRADGAFFKVTVDCPKAPFSHTLIGSMARQAGITVKRLYELHEELS